MPNAADAKIQYEAAQTLVAMVALSDSGDRTIFNSAAAMWSRRSGYTPSVKPDGVATGGIITVAANGGDNDVDVSALTCYLAGTETSVSASADQSATRGSSGTHRITSVTVTSAGAIAMVAGADGGTSFSETRGASGGPPYIPVGSIEVGQVRLSASAAAAVTASEIFQVVGTHQERYDYPTWDVRYATTSNRIIGYAGVTFHSALPQVHTGDTTKGVYAQYYTPVFADVPNGADFVPPEVSHSVSSKAIYGKTLASASSSVNQGSFTMFANQDGVSDSLLALKGANLWFKMYPDELEDPYVAAQGLLGITRSFPADDNISCACTISAAEASIDVIG